MQAADPRAARRQREVDPLGLQAGDTVAVLERAYGLQFSLKGQAEPFFLAVHDKLENGLSSKVVRL